MSSFILFKMEKIKWSLGKPNTNKIRQICGINKMCAWVLLRFHCFLFGKVYIIHCHTNYCHHPKLIVKNFIAPLYHHVFSMENNIFCHSLNCYKYNRQKRGYSYSNASLLWYVKQSCEGKKNQTVEPMPNWVCSAKHSTFCHLQSPLLSISPK